MLLFFFLPYSSCVLHVTRVYGRVSVCVRMYVCMRVTRYVPVLERSRVARSRVYVRAMYVRIYVYNMRSLSAFYL